MDSQRKFYKNLYRSRNVNLDNAESSIFFDNLNLPSISHASRIICEGRITAEECQNVLKTFPTAKTPGNDGLCTSQCKPRPPDPRDIAGNVTFLQRYISTFIPALGGIWTVTIPAPRAPVSKARRALPTRGVWGHAPPENFEILYSQRRIFLHSEALLKMINTTLVESMAICHFIRFP